MKCEGNKFQMRNYYLKKDNRNLPEKNANIDTYMFVHIRNAGEWYIHILFMHIHNAGECFISRVVNGS